MMGLVTKKGFLYTGKYSNFSVRSIIAQRVEFLVKLQCS